MRDMSCDTCAWWDNIHPRLEFAPSVHGISRPGLCRKHKPGGFNKVNEYDEVFVVGIQVLTDASDYCGEYKGTS